MVAIIALIIALSGTSLAAVGGGAPAGGSAPPPCPSRTTRVAGLYFDSAPWGPVAEVKAAADACARTGGYLPTPVQLSAADPELDLGDGRGADNQYTDSYFGGKGEQMMTTVLSEAGASAVRDEDLSTGEVAASFEYTCVHRPGA